LALPAPALPVRAAVRLRLVGADPAARLVGQDPLPGADNDLIGRDPRAWRTGLPTYGAVTATSVYRGIDLTYDGTQGRLEYSFVVAPGADPGAIVLGVEGVRGLALGASGALTLTTAAGVCWLPSPSGLPRCALASPVCSGRRWAGSMPRPVESCLR